MLNWPDKKIEEKMAILMWKNTWKIFGSGFRKRSGKFKSEVLKVFNIGLIIRWIGLKMVWTKNTCYAVILLLVLWRDDLLEIRWNNCASYRKKENVFYVIRGKDIIF